MTTTPDTECMWGWTLARWAQQVGDTLDLDTSDPWQTALTRAALATHIVKQHIMNGVHIIDISSAHIDATVRIASGAVLEPGVVLRGDTSIAQGAVIMAGCHLTDTVVGARAVIKPHSVTDGAVIGDDATVGPSAHLRTGAVLKERVKVGNFVEVKKSVLAAGAKASHLTYIGDSDVGENANIGAGTITCNYDGYGKHRTVIGRGAFIGSNSSLVAPVRIGAGAIVGAGSVITTEVPDDALAVERSHQRNLDNRAPRIRAANAHRAGKTP